MSLSLLSGAEEEEGKGSDENVGTEDKRMNSRQVKVQVEWLFVALRGVVVVRVSCDVDLW